MKRWLLIILLGTFTSLSSQAEPLFKKGVNYIIVKQVSTENPQLMEFFSYFCPHCYQFEPITEYLKSKIPAGTEFKRVPLALLGGPSGPLLQHAFAVAQLLGVTEKMTPVLFNSIQLEHKNLSDESDIKKLFVANEVNGELFDQAWSNLQVEGMINQYNQLIKSYKVYGVPEFIINGKYQICLQKLRGSNARQKVDYLSRLINYLLIKKNH
ncbi:thiol:disulfide interchange protein DsbA/DsbL [Dongshaea marina]|uniref:thiol:disulfide interchange protein DsbA/DsbL n=1 Tax=Dongshaea marina TaxID=2047966 RepID=UPI000D3E0FA3|nr:thiol:disulfide interchange protein DsbA/DsbL [Dongshaea marina]